MNDALDAAVAYAERGYPVFPCVPGLKIAATQHGHLDATTDPEIIRQWWTNQPVANVAISTVDILVVDLDTVDHPLADPELRPADDETGQAALEGAGFNLCATADGVDAILQSAES